MPKNRKIPSRERVSSSQACEGRWFFWGRRCGDRLKQASVCGSRKRGSPMCWRREEDTADGSRRGRGAGGALVRVKWDWAAND